MKFNITFTLKGPSGRLIEAPNTHNPVEADSMVDCLSNLVLKFPDTQLGIEVVSVKIEKVD